MRIFMTCLHVACRARDLHEFLNVAWQPVDVRKARKIVMKSKIVSNTTFKTYMKDFRIFDHEKIAKLLSHSIFHALLECPVSRQLL